MTPPRDMAEETGNAVELHKQIAEMDAARLEQIRVSSRRGSADWTDPVGDARWLLGVVDRIAAIVADPRRQGVYHVPIARHVREVLGMETPW